MRPKVPGVWLAAVCIALAMAAVPALAQSRSSVRFGQVGRMRNIGESGASYTFRGYSYGMGGGQSSYSTDTNVLYQNLSSTGQNYARSTSPLSRAAERSLATGARAYNSYTPSTSAANQLGSTTPSGTGQLPSWANYSSPTKRRRPRRKVIETTPLLTKLSKKTLGLGSSAAQEYLQVLSGSYRRKIAGRRSALTTLVPPQPGPYQDIMQKAETAFRAGNYTQADALYHRAALLFAPAPDNVLGEFLAKFAGANGYYAAPARALRKVIFSVKELPSTSLDIEALYGSNQPYRRDKAELKEYLTKNPANAEVRLVLVFLQWFGDDTDAAVANVRKAWQSRKAQIGSTSQVKDDPVLASIQKFWLGMKETGKVSGELTAPENSNT